MARINLLPWRDELRKQQQQEFLISTALAVALTLVILGMVHLHIEGMQSYQKSRNEILQLEIAGLDRKITEIKDIEEKKNTLLTKIEIIQELQESRPEIVHLFDELARTTPEGIFLTNFKQSGRGLTMNGKAQSNAKVSAYMRAIEASLWLTNPNLNVIQGGEKDSFKHLNDFTLLATQGNDKNDGKEEAEL